MGGVNTRIRRVVSTRSGHSDSVLPRRTVCSPTGLQVNSVDDILISTARRVGGHSSQVSLKQAKALNGNRQKTSELSAFLRSKAKPRRRVPFATRTVSVLL